mmetsp:Transcript_91449/g.167839  ORF Transcript_91449/g.167839 Transcript_91449/m.167839 type:complete len:400 (-) Transcript_91449:12-1211(-)
MRLREENRQRLADVFWQAWRVCQPSSCEPGGYVKRLTESEAEQLCMLANSTLGPLMQSFIDKLEKLGEPIGWSFKLGSEDGRPFRVERPLANHAKVIRWKAVHPSGLGGMFTSGLGLIEKCAERGQALLIDWSSKGLLYSGRVPGSNLWEEFFTQPAAALLSPEELQDALDNGDVADFEGTPCMQTPKVGLPPWHAAKGRLLCQRFAWLRPELRQVALEFAAKELPGAAAAWGVGPNSGFRWLALHIRRTDKGDESPENMALTEEEIIRQTKITCAAWGCCGVYLCSDDWKLKDKVRSMLMQEGLQTATYKPVLSADVTRCAHMNQKLNASRKTWDAMFEITIMSLCQGLLCTHSFMANMVIYFSKPGYLHRSFWDPLPSDLEVASVGIESSVIWEGVD